jgi:O-methyltransferase involved in polyketide biosynthesis
MRTNINPIAENAFLTLECHALDAMTEIPILNDESSLRVLDVLKTQLAATEHPFYKRLAKNKVRKSLVLHTVLRAKRFDEYIKEFLQKNPEATIVNIACGLDHRFERIDNGKVTFFDLDLPDIMNIKSTVFPETERYSQISQSVFDFRWMDRIGPGPVMFVAEGLFMYCLEEDVKKLFLKIQENFPGSEMVCEVFNSKWLTGWRGRMMAFKLKNQLKLGPETRFRFGIPDSEAMESWNKGIRLLDDWSYLDSPEIESAMLKRMGKKDAYRKIQWVVHYKLDK